MTISDTAQKKGQLVTKYKNNSRDGSKYKHCSPH